MDKPVKWYCNLNRHELDLLAIQKQLAVSELIKEQVRKKMITSTIKIENERIELGFDSTHYSN